MKSSTPSKNPIDDLIAIIALGVSMRESQVAYFKNRKPGDLAKSKTLERQFDTRAARALDPKADFFGGPDERF